MVSQEHNESIFDLDWRIRPSVSDAFYSER